MMTPQDEEYFNDMFDLFRSAGWKRLMEEMTTTKVTLNTLDYINDADKFWRQKGMDSVVSDVLTLEDRTTAAYEDALAPGDDDA